MRSIIAGFVFSAVSLVSVAPAGAQTIWEMPTEYPATAIPGEGVATFAQLVNETSGGRLTIKPSFDAARGIKSAAMIAAVQKGEVAAGDAFAGALGAVDPLFGLSSLPFLATSIADARKLTALARPAYDRKLASFGQKILYTTPWPASGIWSKEALNAPTALAGLSIRTYDATSTAVMNAAGAKASNLSFADAMPKVKDGSVTAVLSSGDGGAGRNLWTSCRISPRSITPCRSRSRRSTSRPMRRCRPICARSWTMLPRRPSSASGMRSARGSTKTTPACAPTRSRF
jgi:TRAP-type C4-dicarboxylate transport system substrate-binding protein